MSYSCKQALATTTIAPDEMSTMTITEIVGDTPIGSFSDERPSGSALRRSTTEVGAGSPRRAKGEGDSWAAVAKNVESAISAMEHVAQFVGQNSRNKLSYSLRRCYLRARSIREIRGILHLEDRSDHDYYLTNKCMLGDFLRGEF